MIGFRLPTRVHVAPGARRRLPAVLDALGSTRVLLVCDPGLAATPWPEELRGLAADAGVEVEVFDRLEPNPRTETAEAAADKIRDGRLEAVVALGGGSALDAAKAAAMLATNGGRALDYVGRNRFRAAPLPFVALPTTCGTGSEVTWVSVLSDREAGTKVSIKGDGMFPDQALVDADLLRTLPPPLVAATGADALTHALEATTCTAANPISDAVAAEAVRLLFAFLPRAAADVAGDDEARRAVMLASTLAGIAFGNADVAAVHCLSESLGGLYDVPHGLTNAILLPAAMRYNRPHVDARLAQLLAVVVPAAPAAGDVAARAEAFLERLEALLAELAVPPFSHLGIPRRDHRRIAELAAANGSNPSNPRPMRAADYRRLLDSLA
ncbi:MAG: iron-containing alcohol dehydrogenase [Acidobacteria bacterium]|nr:MAG: iron-containing alcohol dehydrogenase [Acidobacteriota bacterium]